MAWMATWTLLRRGNSLLGVCISSRHERRKDNVAREGAGYAAGLSV